MSDNIVYTLDNGFWHPHPIVTGFAEVIAGSQVSVATSALSAAGDVSAVVPPWFLSLPGLVAYWPMTETVTQLDLVEGHVASMSGVGVGRQLNSPDRWDFGEEIVPCTVIPTGVGVGAVTGTYAFAVQVGYSGGAPYPLKNVGHSDPAGITVSGVDHIEVLVTGAHIPGAGRSINWTIQDVTTGDWKTDGSGNTNPLSHDAAGMAPPYIYSTEAAIPDNYEAPAFQRRSIGYLAVPSNPFGFGGTDSFSGIVKVDFVNYEQGLVENWIVSCFNSGMTEGWGLALYIGGFDSMWLSFQRRNAAGTSALALSLGAGEGAPVSAHRNPKHMFAFTYDGSTMRLSMDADFVGDASMSSSRVIDDSASNLRFGDGYVGVLQPVALGDSAWSEAAITVVHEADAQWTTISNWEWHATTNTTGIAAGEFRKNNAVAASATLLWIHESDDVVPTDQSAGLAALGIGDVSGSGIRIRALYPNAAAPTSIYTWKVTNVADSGSYRTLDVILVSVVNPTSHFGQQVVIQSGIVSH